MSDSRHPLHEFERTSLTHGGITRDVYVSGEGPAVVVMHEVPGIAPAVVSYARKARDRGFRVYVPHVFGSVGVPATLLNGMASIARICVRREFQLLASDRTSPMVDWLRAVVRRAHGECRGPGVGVLGLCITGSFALAMTVDDEVRATVMCEPSLPLAVTPRQRRSLHVSAPDLQRVRRRVAADDAAVVALRFTGDPTCPAARFRRLESELGKVETIEVPRRNARRTSIPAHSPLTTHLIDRPGEPTAIALERTLRFFEERLAGVGA